MTKNHKNKNNTDKQIILMQDTKKIIEKIVKKAVNEIKSYYLFYIDLIMEHSSFLYNKNNKSNENLEFLYNKKIPEFISKTYVSENIGYIANKFANFIDSEYACKNIDYIIETIQNSIFFEISSEDFEIANKYIIDKF